MGYLLTITGVDSVPDYLKDDMSISLNEVYVSKELMKALEQFSSKFENNV